MHVVKPKVHVIAESIVVEGMADMLESVGAPDWAPTPHNPALKSNGEILAEVSGRLCYKSFEVGLNPNVTKVREGTKEYIGNILKQKHGSVLEHASTSVAFIGVSRILTHELVRHRAGMAYSQESMRFVRLDDIGMYIPDLTAEFATLGSYLIPESRGRVSTTDFGKEMNEKFRVAMERVTQTAEAAIAEFTDLLDTPGVPFHIKKKITSALRRMAPGGHTTNIIGTGNHRSWRNIIAQRTAEGAEIEIREAFWLVFQEFLRMYPHFYQDAICTVVEGETPKVMFENDKV